MQNLIINLDQVYNLITAFFDCIWNKSGDSDGKESTFNTGDLGLIPIQYSDRGAGQATVHGVAKSQT